MSTHDANLYEISRLLYDLRNPTNREAVRADPQAYFRRYAIDERGLRLLMNRDWQGLVDAGVTVYLLTKLGAALGVSLLEMGAAMRGMSNEEFRRFIEEQNKRNRPQPLPVAEPHGAGGGAGAVPAMSFIRRHKGGEINDGEKNQVD